MDTILVNIAFNRVKNAGLKKISVFHSSFVDLVCPLTLWRTASPLTLISFRPSSRLLGSRHGPILTAPLLRSGHILTESVPSMSTWNFGGSRWRRACTIALVSLPAGEEGICCRAFAGADYVHPLQGLITPA